MKVAVLGYGSQGESAYHYWSNYGNEVTICDSNKDIDIPKNALAKLGNDYLENLEDFDLLVRTPILHPRQIIEANPNSPDILDKVTSNTNEFFRVCPTKNIIGITGTKGKGTTSTLIAKMLEASGKRVHLGGNIGIPPLELLSANIHPDDWVVLELANFQLIDLKYSPHIAACLMIVPEHLDWHEDMEEYIAAKQQLFINQTSDDIAIYFGDNENSESIASASEGRLIPYYKQPGAYIDQDFVIIDRQKLCKTTDVALLGKHNLQNICAAITTVWQITHDIQAIQSTVTDFSGLPFRIELRAEIDGIRYYNDSFATNGGATNAAINAIPGNKVMIIGGFDRGLDLTELANALVRAKTAIRKVVVIGESAERVVKSLESVNFTNYERCPAKNMEDIVSFARSFAKKGDAIVLSPGFASFDMFKNFEERGNKFNEAIDQL